MAGSSGEGCERGDTSRVGGDGSEIRRFWGEGAWRRVGVGTAAAFTGGSVYVHARGLQGVSALRGGAVCGVVTAPLMMLREVVRAGMKVEGPAASGIAGGVAGYFGGLFLWGPCWRVVGGSAVGVGMGCAMVDWVVAGLDWRRKVLLAGGADEGGRGSWERLLRWVPGVSEVDREYEELLERQRAVVEALEVEQRRIAVLLQALKERRAQGDGERPMA